MDTITVTKSVKWSQADIKAAVLDNGWVKLWYHFDEIDQDRYEIVCTDREWDRLVAWVEWQRKNDKVETTEA